MSQSIYVGSLALKSLKLCNSLFHILNYSHQDAIGRNIHFQLSSKFPLIGYFYARKGALSLKEALNGLLIMGLQPIFNLNFGSPLAL